MAGISVILRVSLTLYKAATRGRWPRDLSMHRFVL